MHLVLAVLLIIRLGQWQYIMYRATLHYILPELAGLLSNGDATVFTAYITANGSYTLSITNAGTLKYAGSATDLAITAKGLLLNIMLIKSSTGVLSSVAQASTLS